MLWMITKDLSSTDGKGDAVGRCGDDLATSLDATHVPAAMRPQIVQECNYEFQLVDADGMVHYEGVCKDLDLQDADSAFEPIDAAESTVGCTTIRYRKHGEGEWQVL